MGLLDKAKKMKKEEGVEAPEPEVEMETAPEPSVKEKKPSVGKPLKKKKPVKSVRKKKPVYKKKPPIKKAVPKKRVKRPKKEVEEEEEWRPAIEGLPEDIEFASIPSRLIAQVIDGIIIFIILGIIGIVLFVGSDGEPAACGVVMLLGLVLPVGYYMMMEGKDGQTFGKRIAHVKVVSLDGQPLKPVRIRNSAIWKGFLFPILNIIDAILGLAWQHKDTLQRNSQYNDDLIVITVKKKKRVYGRGEEEEEEAKEEAEREEEAETAKETESAKEPETEAFGQTGTDEETPVAME